MHPAFYWWWKSAARHGHSGHGHGHGAHGHEAHVEGPGGERRCGPRARHGHDDTRWAGHGQDDGWSFGVRRPLRFLAHKLELSEAQVADLARVIDELKTERAQAEVDHRRTVSAFADAVEGATFGDDRAQAGGELRVKSAERLRDAVTKALSRIHALLDDEQRKRLAYLIRTGVLSL
jgi:Spy/CpxP family protein refolding chaperone